MTTIQRVMIVDDDEDDRDMFCEAVEKVSSKTTCCHAENGLLALEMLTAGKNTYPDLIFLDLNMPRLNGKELLAKLKKIEKVKKIPVIIYSTSDLAADKRETKALGAADFLHKPSQFVLLCEKLQFIFENRNTYLS